MNELFGDIEQPQLTQILPAVQLSGTSNVTVVDGLAAQLILVVKLRSTNCSRGRTRSDNSEQCQSQCTSGK